MSKSLEYLENNVVIDLTKRLIKNQSPSGNEKKIATLMAIEMKKAGFYRVQYDESNNIVGVMPGLTNGKTLVLAGNIDTVPPGSMANPFEPQEIDGSKLGSKGKVITGRGSCDMKGALAAMISAGSALKRARARLKGDYVVVGLTNTKIGKSTGLNAVLEKFEIKPDYIVACAPTDLNINTAHPGQATFEITAKGKMTNIGNSETCENAILKMTKIINCIQENTILPEDKQFGKANMIISSIASEPIGESHSVPNLCQALLVRQFFKNENPEKIKNDLLNLLKTNSFKEQDVDLNLKRSFAPHEVDSNVDIISIIQEANEIAVGKPTKISHWSSGINISEMLDTNFPVVGIGPGNENFAYTPNEHVSVDQVIKAAKIYTALAEKICVHMKVKAQ
ncbi:MAG: M20/M25/M40 family metallo-hydrolase [Candidatus Heimdallarchaeota archaeon]|nr:M20/M25/M40 family metallo-hydrolase [Candidatus Heimdallarchaeota archaeon]